MLTREEIENWDRDDEPVAVPQLPRSTHWAVTGAGLSVYRAGELVAVVPGSQLGEMAFQIAAVRRR